jgi:glutathione S-transferase
MPGTDTRPVLYTCPGSRGLRVSWAAMELGIALEYRMLPFPPRVHARDYLDVNPLGTVPALVHDGHVLTESSAIVHYLATRWGPTALAIAPGERDYGAYLDFLHYADATITFPQTVFLRFAVFEPDSGLAAAGEAYATWFEKRLIKAEQHLESREYLCADRFTGADIAVAYALYLSARIGLDHLVPPSLKAYRARMTSRPGFLDAVAAEAAAAEAQGVA